MQVFGLMDTDAALTKEIELTVSQDFIHMGKPDTVIHSAIRRHIHPLFQ